MGTEETQKMNDAIPPDKSRDFEGAQQFGLGSVLCIYHDL